MKFLFVILMGSLAVLGVRAQTSRLINLPLAGYQLVWSDASNVGQIDSNKWEFRTNSEMWSAPTPTNISVDDGKLFLAVKNEAVDDKHHAGAGGNDPEAAAHELGVCENDSLHPGYYGVNVHQWNPKPRVAFGTKTVRTPSRASGFHIVGYEFMPPTVKYYFDGNVVQTVVVSNFAPDEQNIWLTTIASPLGNTKAVDNTKWLAAAEYDDVRFYQKL